MTANQNEKEVEALPTESNKPIAAKPRINPVAQYLLALAAVVGAYSGYAKFLVPVIEGPPNIVKKEHVPFQEDAPTSSSDKSQFAGLLPTDAWELTDCKTLVIDAGTILFKELKKETDGTLSITPFTLITGMKAVGIEIDPATSTASSPTVLRCMSGAKLRFDKPIQDIFSDGAKLETARLIGQVDIYRPPTDANKNDALHIVTSNVQVDKRRIYSLEKVQFTFGSNRGRGRNMLIDFDHESSPPDFSNIKGVRRIELAFLDRLRIEPTQESSPAQTATLGSTTPTRKLFSGSKSPLEISCQGAFVFDFRSQIASFEKQVVAQQDDAFNDQINCEKLILTFEDKPKLAAVIQPALNHAPASSAKQISSNTDIQLKHFVAEGSPAIVISRSRSAKVTGAHLSYNVNNNQIVGRCDSSGNHDVTIVSPEYQLVAKKLSYVIPDNGSLGEVDAIGAGNLLQVATATKDEFFASWKNSLTTRAVPETPGLQQVIIDGEAKIRIAKDTRIDSDRLEMLVWQSEQLTTDLAGKTKREWSYQPSRLFTSGNVVIVSPKLDGQAQFLTATWPELDKQMLSQHSFNHRVGYRGTWQTPQRIQNQTRADRLVRIQNDNYTQADDLRIDRPSPLTGQQLNPSSGWVELLPRNSKTENSGVKRTGFQQDLKAVSPDHKLKFKGETVDVRLVGSGDQTRIRDLTVVGDVTIVNQPIDATGNILTTDETPLTITGHRLQLTPQSKEGNYRTLVTGKNGEMAQVTKTGFWLQGQSINLDQEANKVWVEGEGAIKMKVASTEKQPNQSALTLPAQTLDSAPASIVQPQDLDVAWKGGMIFDGYKIYFERRVVLSANQIKDDGNQSNIQSLSEGLSVELTAPIDFQNMDSTRNKTKAKIRELVLVDEIPDTKKRFKLVKTSGSPDNLSNVSIKSTDSKRPIIIENRTFNSDGRLIEKQKIVLPQAVVDVDAGTVKGKGPGSIATHRWKDPEKSKDAKPNPFGRIGKNDNQSGISFVQVNFDGELNVNQERSEMILDRNIRTVYSPVRDWGTTFNPDDPQRRVAGAVYLTCEKLQLAQWTPRASTKKSNEMIATGNAHILSDEFEATANRVSYSQATDLLVIVGSARNNATLKTDADKFITAEKFTYRIKDKWTTIQSIGIGKHTSN